MPARRDIDPIDIPGLLSGLVLVDVVQQTPLTLRYRLVGTMQVDIRGRDPTGMDVLDAYYAVSARPRAEQRRAVLENYRAVVEERTWLYLNNPLYDRDRRSFYLERLFLPLSADDDIVNIILAHARCRRKPRLFDVAARPVRFRASRFAPRFQGAVRLRARAPAPCASSRPSPRP